MEKISVVIPVYNSAQYLEQCMESVINQTYKNLEIICVDGGSTDGSLQILERYQKDDNRMIIVRNQGDGLSQARKDGLRIATGKYISHIDSDDWLDLTMYEKMIAAAEKFNAEAVMCNYYDVKGETWYPAVSRREEFLDNSSEEKMVYRNIYDVKTTSRILNWSFWTYLFRKDAIYPYQMDIKRKFTCGEDLMCIWPFLAEACRVYVLNEALYYYRTRVRVTQIKCNPLYLSDVMEAYNIICEKFSNHRQKEYLQEILKTAFYNIAVGELQRFFLKEEGEFCMFPYELIPPRSKIVLYGAGFMGKSYYKQIMGNKYCDIVLWVDREYEQISDDKYRISDPALIERREYDYILIAARYERTAESIRNYLVRDKKINEEKIVWSYPKQLSLFV